MEAIRKIARVKDNTISFKELARFNNKDVECIVFPFTKKNKIYKKNLLSQYDGIFSSSHNDTSENVDDIIYGK